MDAFMLCATTDSLLPHPIAIFETSSVLHDTLLLLYLGSYGDLLLSSLPVETREKIQKIRDNIPDCKGADFSHLQQAFASMGVGIRFWSLRITPSVQNVDDILAYQTYSCIDREWSVRVGSVSGLRGVLCELIRNCGRVILHTLRNGGQPIGTRDVDAKTKKILPIGMVGTRGVETFVSANNWPSFVRRATDVANEGLLYSPIAQHEVVRLGRCFDGLQRVNGRRDLREQSIGVLIAYLARLNSLVSCYINGFDAVDVDDRVHAVFLLYKHTEAVSQIEKRQKLPSKRVMREMRTV